MTRTISNSDDVIDSRDVIARLGELQDLQDAIDNAQADLDNLADDATEDEREAAQAALDDATAAFDDDEQGELADLKSLAEEAAGYAPDWEHGECLIRESYFVEYCQELIEDIGDLPKDLPHYIEIDWEATARNIRMDYTSVEYGEVTYLIR